MLSIVPLVRAVWLAIPVGMLLACSGGGGRGAGDGPGAGIRAEPFFIVSCSLGCAERTSEDPGPFGCNITGVALNEELTIEFSAPVDLDSVDARTFIVTELGTGARPSGTFTLDPADANRLMFRPNLGFDSTGDAVYGFSAGSTYSIDVPGTATGGGNEFVSSLAGVPNSTPFVCSISAQDRLIDVRLGAPSVEVFLDVVTDVDPTTGEVLAIERELLANGGELLEDVHRRTEIKMVFDDLLDPATLANPISGVTDSMFIGIDADGDLSDGSDRVPVPGTFATGFDYVERTTTVVFTPAIDLPSRGPDPDSPRLIAVELTDRIRDLGGNELANAGTVIGIPERLLFPPTLLPDGVGEDFSTTEHRDELHTGAVWGPQGLAPGVAGGSGRLGSFRPTIDDGLVSLNTDSTTFESPNTIDDYDPVTGMPGDGVVTVDDGIFEFSFVHIGPGARVRVEGSKPARILSRGWLVVDGILDLAGDDVPVRDSMPCDPLQSTGPEACDFGLPPSIDEFNGGAGGQAGAGGGDGGQGGDLPDSDPTLVAVGGLDNPHALIDTQGRDGAGIPFPSVDDPQTFVGGGEGGVQWPTDLPSSATDLGNMMFNFLNCKSSELGGSGAGGGYGSAGERGLTGTAQTVGFSKPPEALGGDTAGFLDSLQRELAPERGHLRGGSGGGGGGAHAASTRNQNPIFPCIPSVSIGVYRPSIGNGGGGAGGAIELHAARVLLSGVIEVNGGSGGDVIRIPQEALIGAMERVSAGGGGSGGAILVRTPDLDLADLPGRFQVEGGRGGIGIEDAFPDDGAVNFSVGGRGGAGLVRIESGPEPLSLESAAERMFPTPDDLDDLEGTVAIEDLLSVAPFVPRDEGPEARSGAQSCWMQPPGNPFLVTYPADEEPGEFVEPQDELGALGWDMQVFIAGVGPVSWRRPGALFPGLSLEELIGSNLGSSPLVVRFQGARALVPIGDLCSVTEEGPASPLFGSSITPWVRHPSELNDAFESLSRKPNLIRYQIVFDRSHPLGSLVEGVTRVVLRARPE